MQSLTYLLQIRRLSHRRDYSNDNRDKKRTHVATDLGIDFTHFSARNYVA